MNIAAGQAGAVAHDFREVGGARSAKPVFLDFFAGSGLVSHALSRWFDLAWANDVCGKKAAVFRANHPGKPFILGSVSEVRGGDVPSATLSWASFPCQDLSLAGAAKGIRASRSGLVWEWLRVMDAMDERPPVVVAENVVGLLSAHDGRHYKELHEALIGRGYRVGAIVLDAVHFVPQSRPRVFVVGVSQNVSIPPGLVGDGPNWLHPAAIARVAETTEAFIWWKLPKPHLRRHSLSDIVDRSRPCHDEATSQKNLALIPPAHRRRLEESGLDVVPGYRRIRDGRQVLELRFDDVAGCLRTPAGGSSRQLLVMRDGGRYKTRLLTAVEAARLMGAPRQFKLPGSDTDAYRAMGDAVAVPVAAFLARHLLSKLIPVHDEST
ncbi:DNA cytosine methyltransferase [Desulfovibrio sp. TomC]|uniref:DNA cytosine methyltransferase n=1 Tax=Desulfovibrio sp. TomC TaxID=1562888 RepID=UPI0005759D15|nr:DNA cytosine methyltransferase [Desulfovibrio sp. TomC]KHK00592.1 DNA-cytosine methyltransferase [Desulfovibrio sp. TomC]